MRANNKGGNLLTEMFHDLQVIADANPHNKELNDRVSSYRARLFPKHRGHDDISGFLKFDKDKQDQAWAKHIG